MKVNKERKLIIVLVILLAIAAGYITFDYFQRQKTEELTMIYQEGYEQGITDIAISLYDNTEDCNIAFVNIGNSTRNIIDVDCLKQ